MLDLEGFDMEFMDWLLDSLVLDCSFFDLRLKLVPPPGRLVEPATRAVIAFLKKYPIRSISLKEKGLPLFTVLPLVPNLEHLKLAEYNFSSVPPLALEAMTNMPTKLHTIDLYECSLSEYNELPSELHSIITIPSLQNIRYLDCGDYFVPEEQERFRELLSAGVISSNVTEAPQLHYNKAFNPFMFQ
ncbi:hypothetical protein RhiLY_12234 [Ceratobasidium sp. AG-Ba]|nr:hypothetical protein RhiLY_12234 [Ceratobasidium sp. AG-Ba]